MKPPTERFSSRVGNYIKYRPSYPAGITEFLVDHAGLAGATVADIGSGPGNLTRLLLPAAGRVYGVEPNRDMREAGEELLREWLHPAGPFVSVDGTAEATSLADASVDLIVAGQAFHWFDLELTKQEFQRVLRPGGAIALVWNERNLADGFSEAYDAFLRDSSDEYGKTTAAEKTPQPVIEEFLAPAKTEVHDFDNHQILDWVAFCGRVESSSYFPDTDQPNYVEVIEGLRHLFDTWNKDGFILFRYRTRLYFGRW